MNFILDNSITILFSSIVLYNVLSTIIPYLVFNKNTKDTLVEDYTMLQWRRNGLRNTGKRS